MSKQIALCEIQIFRSTSYWLKKCLLSLGSPTYGILEQYYKDKIQDKEKTKTISTTSLMITQTATTTRGV